MEDRTFPAYTVSTEAGPEGDMTAMSGPVHNAEDLRRLVMDLADEPYRIVGQDEIELIARSNGPRELVDAAWAALDREDGRLELYPILPIASRALSSAFFA